MKALLNPITVNQLSISNRLVMPPMATGKADPQGQVTDKLCDFYSARAEGGHIGLIITEHCYVHQQGIAHKKQIAMDEHWDHEGLKQLVSSIQKDGTKVFCQLNHAGGKADTTLSGLPAVSASSVQFPNSPISEVLCSSMTVDEIHSVVAAFASAAARVKEAGFDGVEIHAAHGYLLNQFFSPLSNLRRDEYAGNTLEGRIRFHLEVIHAVRDAVGPHFPVAIRLGACDYLEGGSTLEDSVLACQAFQQAGVDLLDISGGFCYYTHPTKKEQGYFSELSEVIKSNVSIPVILTGGVKELNAAEELLVTEKADMIGVGRMLFKRPQWAKTQMESFI